jgi:hypothetical protein
MPTVRNSRTALISHTSERFIVAFLSESVKVKPPMAVAAIASGSKSKNSSAFEHEKSTPSKMKECCVLCH